MKRREPLPDSTTTTTAVFDPYLRGPSWRTRDGVRLFAHLWVNRHRADLAPDGDLATAETRLVSNYLAHNPAPAHCTWCASGKPCTPF